MGWSKSQDTRKKAISFQLSAFSYQLSCNIGGQIGCKADGGLGEA
jgi:hypothetical protein